MTSNLDVPNKSELTELDGTLSKATTNTGAWANWDLSAIVPANSIVLVDCTNASGGGAQLGLRTDGSALSRVLNLGNTVHTVMLVKASAASIIEYWDSANGSTYFVLGYLR